MPNVTFKTGLAAALTLLLGGCAADGDSAPERPQRAANVAVLAEDQPSAREISRACAPRAVDDVQTNWDVGRTYLLCYDAESDAGPGEVVVLEDDQPSAREIASPCDPAGVYALDVNWDIGRTYIICEDLEAPEGQVSGHRVLGEPDPGAEDIRAACRPDHPASVDTNWDVDRADVVCQRRP